MTNPPPVAPVVTDEMVSAAVTAYVQNGKRTSDMFVAMKAALVEANMQAVASGELERLRAENEKLRVDRGFAIGWITALANNPYKPMTWMQTREAAADCLAALQGDAP